MAALTGPRVAPFQTIKTMMFPLKAGAKAFRGGACAADTTNGWVLPAAQAANLIVIGQFEADVDNSASTATSYVNVTLAREIEVQFYDNDTGSNKVTAGNLFSNVYVKDDHTVSTNAGGSSIVMGRMWMLDERGVGVQHNGF